jgi:hypothetical protein
MRDATGHLSRCAASNGSGAVDRRPTWSARTGDVLGARRAESSQPARAGNHPCNTRARGRITWSQLDHLEIGATMKV